jgi:protein regulator of cytokinesis 1
MLEEYGNARKEKEQERKRQRDQRRLQQGAAAPPERDASPVARQPPKNIKNVTRTLSMGRNGGGGGGGGGGSARKASAASSRPGTPSYLKSPMSARRGASDEGQMMASDSFE